MKRLIIVTLLCLAIAILIAPEISKAACEVSLDEGTREMISEVVKELLGSNISGDEEFHAESVTDGRDISAWLFNLKNGDIACFEVPDDRSGLYLNMGSDKGTFRVNFGERITLGDRVY